MLVLSRRESERIRIGDSIVVTVVRCMGDKVRIGIEAPPEMLILRGELKQHAREESNKPESALPKRPGAPVDYPLGASIPSPVF